MGQVIICKSLVLLLDVENCGNEQGKTQMLLKKQK